MHAKKAPSDLVGCCFRYRCNSAAGFAQGAARVRGGEQPRKLLLHNTHAQHAHMLIHVLSNNL